MFVVEMLREQKVPPPLRYSYNNDNNQNATLLIRPGARVQPSDAAVQGVEVYCYVNYTKKTISEATSRAAHCRPVLRARRAAHVIISRRIFCPIGVAGLGRR